VILQVRSGEWKRVFPKAPAKLDCSPKNLEETDIVEPGGK